MSANIDNVQTAPNEPKQRQGGGINWIFRYLLIFVAISMVTKLFNKTPTNSKNNFKNILDPNELFRLSFYSSDKNNLQQSDLEKQISLLHTDQILFANTTRSFNLSIPFNNIYTNNLYLYALVNFSPETEKIIKKSFSQKSRATNMNYEHLLVYKINIIKNKKNLTTSLKQQKQMNDYYPIFIISLVLHYI